MQALYYLLKELGGWLDRNGQPTHTPDGQEAVTFTVPSQVLTAIRWYLEHRTILTPPRQTEIIPGRQLDSAIKKKANSIRMLRIATGPESKVESIGIRCPGS